MINNKYNNYNIIYNNIYNLFFNMNLLAEFEKQNFS